MLGAGCTAGVLAGLFGIGGGIVLVPVLEFVLSVVGVDEAIRMHIAVATSLATIIPTSISSARAHHQRGAVDVSLVRRWGVFVLLGALLGAFIASQMHGRSLTLLFALLAIVVALKMLFFSSSRNLTAGIPKSPVVMLIPTAIGGLSSMMGIGGGTFSVMVLTLFNQPIHRAVGTAALIGLVISLPGTLGFVIAGWNDPRLLPGSLGFVSIAGLVVIAPAAALCAPLGARLAHAYSEVKLKKLFGVCLLIAAIHLLFKVYS